MIKGSAQVAARQWLTPPEVARERGIKASKVLMWIASGELVAVNHAGQRNGRPRWRISPEALNAFDAARSCRANISPTASSRRQKPHTSTIQFF